MKSVAYAPYLPRVYHLMLKGLTVLLQAPCGKEAQFMMGQSVPVLLLFPSLTVLSGAPAWLCVTFEEFSIKAGSL